MPLVSFALYPGHAPLLISMPHLGTTIPTELRGAYVTRALATEDTDWHLNQLYDFVADLGASLLMPQVSRYVIDLNRPPDDAPMYPGASNTELCPTRFFTGEPLYRPGAEPDLAERQRRRQVFWQPYHEALAGELQRLRDLHGHVLLWDAHSIRSQIPWLFAGRLPDLNFGTADGSSADASIAAGLMRACAGQQVFGHVLNGRFKGGYITRRYGAPKQGVHAVQLEMCQHLYMQEHSPYAFDADRAATVRPLLRTLLGTAMMCCSELHG